MSLSGSKQSSESKLDPQFKEAYLSNLASVQDVAGNLQARQFAGFTPDQEAAFSLARQFADPNSEAFTGMRSAFDVAGRVWPGLGRVRLFFLQAAQRQRARRGSPLGRSLRPGHAHTRRPTGRR